MVWKRIACTPVLVFACLAGAKVPNIRDGGRAAEENASGGGNCIRQDVAPLSTDVFKLSTAQNALNYRFFTEEYFNKILPPLGPQQTVQYGTEYGSDNLRSLVAEMLSDRFKVRVNPDLLYGTAGVTAGLNSFMSILQNTSGEDNGVLTATPYWPGFRWTAEQLHVNGMLIPFEVSDKETMQLSVQDVQDAIEANPTARFLVICNPQNPLGIIYDSEKLEEIYSYVLQKFPEMHIISDEMYAHSVIDGHDDKFVSALALDAYTNGTEEQKQHVHVVWGFAKDFGLNGWKAGFLHSSHPQVIDAFRPTNAKNESLSFVMTPISALTSFYLEGLLSATTSNNEVLWKSGMVRYREELTKSHTAVKDVLNDAGIKFFEHNYGAQFFWVDLTGPTQIVGGEENMTELFAASGLALGAGAHYNAPQEGYYRICYTCYELDEVLRGIDILVSTVASVEANNTSGADRALRGADDIKEKVKAVYADFRP